MAFNFNVPLNIKIREGIRVNLSLTVSHAVEKDLPQKFLKKEIREKVQDGTLKRRVTDEDYEIKGNADTVSFWFIGGTSLSYRVGEEITQQDFDRIKGQLDRLEFHERKPSDNKADKTTK